MTSHANAGTTATYSYNGDGLRASKTVNGTTTRFTWDAVIGGVPLLLSDGTSSYVYGPSDLAIEQLKATPTVVRVATGSAIDNVGTSTSLSVDFSAAAQNGDQILLAANSVAGEDPVTPTGYTQVGSYPAPNAGETTTIYRRTATGGETSAAVAFTGTLPHAKTVLAVVYRGVNAAAPVEATSAAGTSAATATSIGVPGVTTTTDGDMLVLVQAAANNLLTGSWTAPAGMTDAVHAGAATVGSAVSDQTVLMGATGAKTATFSQPAQLEAVLLTLQRASDTYFINHDQQGSTRVLTDTTGHVASVYDYDPYGRTVAHSGETISLLYDGQYQDGETGDYYLHARYYDPATAQFLTRDPLEAITRSPYGYVDGDPLDGSDPTGMDHCIPFTNICVGFHPGTIPNSIVNIGRGMSFGLSDKIANWISPGASVHCPAEHRAAARRQRCHDHRDVRGRGRRAGWAGSGRDAWRTAVLVALPERNGS